MSRYAWAALALLVLAACTADAPPAPEAEPPASAVKRIVALAPHLTELVYSAGAGERLVGVVAWSDYPPAALSLPLVGDAFRVDLERLAQLEPDLVLAWESGNPREVIAQLRQQGYRVVSLATQTLDDVAANLIEIGRLAATEGVAQQKAAHFREALEALRQRYDNATALNVFYQISPAPLYTVGAPHPITEMIEVCGGRNIFSDLDAMAPVVSLEDVILRDPDVILAAPPPGDDSALLAWQRWPQLRAVADAHLYAVDPSLVARSSTRILDGLAEICTALDSARR